MNLFDRFKKIAQRDNWKDNASFRLINSPSPEFVERTKERFVAEFHREFRGTYAARVRRTPYFASGFASGIALAIFVSSGAVYANERDVAPSNALYPLKRMHEFFVLKFTDEADKPLVYLRLAERRLGEIEETAAATPGSATVERLKADFAQAVDYSLPTLERGAEAEEEIIAEPPSLPAPSFQQETAIRIASSASGFPAGAVSKSEEGNGEKEKEKEDKETAAPQAGGEMQEVVPKRKHDGVSSVRARAVCQSWSVLLSSEVPEAQEIVRAHTKAVEQFERRCR